MSTKIAKVGEYVAIEFHSTDASGTPAAITLKDANGATRTLKAYERLRIDSLAGDAVVAASDASTDIRVTLFGDYDAGADIDANERIWVFQGVGVFDGGIEGYSVKTGITPVVQASGAGTIDINGTGRVVLAQTRPNRPDWKESLTPGGGLVHNLNPQ